MEMCAKAVYFTTDKAGKIRKWKVKEGMVVSARQVLLLYDLIGAETGQQLKFKSTQVGTVRKRIAKEGDIVHPGGILLELEECSHPTVMKDMCAECGADLRKEEQQVVNASVPMVHSIPELKVSEEQAQIIGKADENRLIQDKKLVLLVDLDQTLIHTTNDNIPPNLKDVYHFQLYGPQSPWYHTRIRPRTHEFLKEISKLYELHICTFGARNYAHMIAMFLDQDGKYFSHRILSRDECFSANSKTANLKALFPCGDNMVCIIDDREDVWNHAPNLIHVKPYHFFKHTGDINAPPGFSKKENDEVDGFDFAAMDQGKEKAGVEVSEDLKDMKEHGKDKKPATNKPMVEALGESTTDKDTEDETDRKGMKKTIEADIEKVTEDLHLSEDDSEMEQSGKCKNNNNEGVMNRGETEERDSVKVVEGENNETDDVSVVTTEESGKKEDVEGNIERKHGDEIEKADICEKKNEKRKVNDVKNTKDTEVCENSVKSDLTMQKDEEGIKKEVEKKEKENEKMDVDVTNESQAQIEKITDTKDQVDGKEGETKEDLIEVEDHDDYLLYLEDILKSIHKAYYELYESRAGADMPDLKAVIPGVKRLVLEGCQLVFSGLVPSHVPLEQSRAYLVAMSLGAAVAADMTKETTHLVAARPGTAKVNSARRQKGIVTVTPLWLWSCAERWERLDERLYPLGRGSVANRHPPAHCGSPEHTPPHGDSGDYTPATRERTLSGRFIDTINPLLTFSSEDMQIMDREVADLFKEEDESDSEVEEVKDKVSALKRMDTEEESSSEDSLSGGAGPKGWSDDALKRAKKRKMDTTTCTESDLDDESPAVKFRRGEPLPSDLDLNEDSQDSPGSEEPMEGDDGDWSVMGAALEREFLSGE